MRNVDITFLDDQLDMEAYEDNDTFDVDIAPLNWGKEWPPHVKDPAVGKQNYRTVGQSLPPLPPANNTGNIGDKGGGNSYDNSLLKNNDMFLLGVAPNSVFYASNDDIENDIYSEEVAPSSTNIPSIFE